MKSKTAPTGIMLYAKNSGLTSFSSLWSIKHALGTEKVGHTGTLDSFADGLLVVLAGNLTHLVPHVTGFTKTYEAIVCFGRETDTLDPTGRTVKTCAAVSRKDLEEAIPKFTGAILQTPPAFSALHVDGKRASDLVREGKEVRLESRQIFIYSIRVHDFLDNVSLDGCTYAKLEITCSKGTYIRALARDIAASAGSCAHLCALRRTRVGPFNLEDAACYSSLGEFNIHSGMEVEKKIQQEEGKSLLEKAEEKIFSRKKEKTPRQKDSDKKIADIKSRFLNFTPDLAALCGFECFTLKNESEKKYANGKPLSGRMFDAMEGLEVSRDFFVKDEAAVYYSDGKFAGIIRCSDGHLRYGFVVPRGKKSMQVFTWNELCDGAFPVQWKKKGSAITVGSFEAVHRGHQELISAVTGAGSLVSGVVTFASSISRHNPRNIFTLGQRLEFFESLGLDFAVVIDFNEDFSRMDGKSFIATLVEKCALRFLAEGRDFKCGYQGSCRMEDVQSLAGDMGFELKTVDYIRLAEEKVGSSRIKGLIEEGQLEQVTSMLGRPFSCSLEGLKWTEKSRGQAMSVFESAAGQNQVLPKNGTYSVVARFSDGSRLHTELFIEGNTLNLQLPTKKYANMVVSVEF